MPTLRNNVACVYSQLITLQYLQFTPQLSNLFIYFTSYNFCHSSMLSLDTLVVFDHLLL